MARTTSTRTTTPPAGRLLSVLLVAGIGAPLISVTGCGRAYENICRDGEVAVINRQGSSWCEPPEDGDRKCPSGEILVKTQWNGKDYCIDEEWREGWQKAVPGN